MPRPDSRPAELEAGPIVARVLSRLAAADRERTRVRARQRRQRLVVFATALLGLAVCLASASSDLATHLLAWSLAADAAWGAVVRVLLGGLGFLPVLSAACMCLVAGLLWRRLINTQNRGMR
jgi:hypothetical protein